MAKRIKVILVCLVLTFLVGVGFVLETRRLTETSVKGISISVSPAPTIFLSPTPSFTPEFTPTATVTPTTFLRQVQPTLAQKQFGGWYWRPELKRTQRWMGADSEGKDIWSDSGDLPTQTPTPSPTYSPQPNNSSSTSNSSGISAGFSVRERVVRTEVSIKKVN